MSPRVLKTKFPCVHCGAPAEVERLRYAERAVCDRCSDRFEATSRWRWGEERAHREATKANELEGRAQLVAWLDVVAVQLKAVAARVRSLPLLTPAERRKVAIGAGVRLKNARQNLRTLAPLLVDVVKESDSLEIISGDRAPSEVERPAPRLVLLSRGGQTS